MNPRQGKKSRFQVETLEGRIALSSGVPTSGLENVSAVPAVVTPDGGEASHPILQLGARGDAVKKLQGDLVQLKYDIGRAGVDGIFGRDTEGAVKAFQKDLHLEVDGIVGPQTWDALRRLRALDAKLRGWHLDDTGPAEKAPSPTTPNEASTARPILRLGSQGEDVKYLQESLGRVGYNLGPYGVDGEFGPDTEGAVQAFQEANHLEVDGIVGPQTWAALGRSLGTPAPQNPAPQNPAPQNPGWSPENENQVKAYIKGALDRHSGNVELAFADLRDQRQRPENYYNTNLAIAADYLRARWDAHMHGPEGEAIAVETYLALKRTGHVPKEGPGPVSPYSDLEAKYMRQGIIDETNQMPLWKQIAWVPVSFWKMVFDNARAVADARVR